MYQVTVIAYPVLSDIRVAISVLDIGTPGNDHLVWSSWSQIPCPPWAREAPEDWVQVVGDQVLTQAFRRSDAAAFRELDSPF